VSTITVAMVGEVEDEGIRSGCSIGGLGIGV
jgi:hypothetical protein